MKTSSTLTAVALLVMTGTCAAQQPPAGVTPDMINTTLPEEGAPKAVPGPYAVTVETAPGLRTFRPTSLDKFPKSDHLPVVVWGNGGCAADNPKYNGFLTTIASHGFLVITTAGAAQGEGEGAQRRRATAEDLKGAIDWADAENQRAGSPLNGKIDTKHVAVMGQSCGGSLSLALGADPRVGTIGVFNSGAPAASGGGSGPTAITTDALTKLHGPVLLINGHERDFMMARSKATYDAIDKLPAFYGARHGAGHTATVYHVGGGEFANVASNWVLWQFKGDKKASTMFVGKNCSLCTNSNWDAESKRLTK